MISFEMVAMDSGCSALEVALYYVIGAFVTGRRYPCPSASLSWINSLDLLFREVYLFSDWFCVLLYV